LPETAGRDNKHDTLLTRYAQHFIYIEHVTQYILYSVIVQWYGAYHVTQKMFILHKYFIFMEIFETIYNGNGNVML